MNLRNNFLLGGLLITLCAFFIGACSGGGPEPLPTQRYVPKSVGTSTEVPTVTQPTPQQSAATESVATTETPSEVTQATADAGRGEALYVSAGCVACHSTGTDARVGPGWGGIYGTEEALEDGRIVVVDAQYIRKSILDTNSDIVEGYAPGIMPQNFAETLTEQNLLDLIAFIESL